MPLGRKRITQYGVQSQKEAMNMFVLASNG
jgi:hypothetical protein